MIIYWVRVDSQYIYIYVYISHSSNMELLCVWPIYKVSNSYIVQNDEVTLIFCI
jgi:hypothetical protein